MKQSRKRQIIELIRRKGILRPRELNKSKIPREYLSRLAKEGSIVKSARGLYTMPDKEITAFQSMVEVCKLVPHGIICLLSALQFHELTTQAPAEIWLAIGAKKWKPKLKSPLIHHVYLSGKSLSQGIEKHIIEGIEVKVYSAAKTVADCFKFRNKIGQDVAIEALRDCLRQKKCSVDELWSYAKICRVQNVMRPYLEAIV